MTLKGLAEGDVVNNVTIKSDKHWPELILFPIGQRPTTLSI